MPYSAFTDEELIRHVHSLVGTTPLEGELTCRLERALEEVDDLTQTSAPVAQEDMFRSAPMVDAPEMEQ